VAVNESRAKLLSLLLLQMKMTKGLTMLFLLLALATTLVFMAGLAALQVCVLL